MKRVLFALVTITLLLLVLAACKPKEAAPAEETPMEQPTPASIFVKTDANNDGMITADEHKQRMEVLFDTIDTNKDGSLDAVEIDAHVQSIFAAMDGADADAQITAAEHNKFFMGEEVVEEMATDKPIQGHAWHWANRDHNADGNVDKSEFAFYAKRQFMNRDANADGNVSKEEFEAYQKAIYTSADANKDGMVSKEEFLTAISM